MPIRSLLSKWKNPAVRTHTNGPPLPPEIIDLVYEHLSAASAAAFGLTCGYYYTIYFLKQDKLDIVAKRQLLQLLEKDVGHLYFCSFCSKLRPWGQQWGVKENPKQTSRPCSHLVDFSLLYQFSMPYDYARLVVNRHLYGSSHGLPLERLKYVNAATGSKTGTSIKSSWHGRIIDDELFLCCEWTICHPKGDAQNLREAIDDNALLVCKHLYMHDRARNPSPRDLRLPELDPRLCAPEAFSSQPGSYGSCPLCMTDYKMTISWQGRRKGWVVEVVSWHQFGRCRDPLDWNWHVMTREGYLSDGRWKHHGPAAVRRRWLQEGSAGPEGKFIVPEMDRFDEFLGLIEP